MCVSRAMKKGFPPDLTSPHGKEISEDQRNSEKGPDTMTKKSKPEMQDGVAHFGGGFGHVDAGPEHGRPGSVF